MEDINKQSTKLRRPHITLVAAVVVLTTLALAACNRKPLLDETHDLGGTWNRFKNEVFEVEVKNTDDYYDIYLKAVFDTSQFHYASLPVNINIYSSDGERRMFSATLPLRDRQQMMTGKMIDGYLVVDHRVRDLFSFNSKGSYRIEVGQATQYYDIHGIKSVSLHIEPADLDLPE